MKLYSPPNRSNLIIIIGEKWLVWTKPRCDHFQEYTKSAMGAKRCLKNPFLEVGPVFWEARSEDVSACDRLLEEGWYKYFQEAVETAENYQKGLPVGGNIIREVMSREMETWLENEGRREVVGEPVADGSITSTIVSGMTSKIDIHISITSY